jgi:outer membrane protein
MVCALLLPLSLFGMMTPDRPCRAEEKKVEEKPVVLTLSEGLRIAAESNRTIKIASRGRDVSSADVLAARSSYLPAVNGSLSQTFLARQTIAVFGPFVAPETNKSYFSYGLDVRQDLYDFGARSSRYQAASTSLDAAILNIDLVKNLTALDFIVAYFDLLESEKLELVGEREVERLISHLSTAQSLYKEGVITRNDLLQAEVRLSDAQQRLLTAANVRAVNASRLNNILSFPLSNPVRVEDITGEPGFESNLERAWEAAEQKRIELKTIDREIEINGFERAGRQSEFFPTIFAEGGYNYTANRYQLHDDNWMLVLGLNINIFSGGYTKAQIAKIDYRREQLLEQRRKLVDDIRLDVEKSWLDMRNAGDRIGVTRDAVQQAEENLKINKSRYREGVGTALDVLDAITLLTTAETNYYRAEYELRRAQGAFMYAMGLDLTSKYREVSE